MQDKYTRIATIGECMQDIWKLANKYKMQDDPFFATIYHSMVIQAGMLEDMETRSIDADKYTTLSDSICFKATKLQDLILQRIKLNEFEEEQQYFN